MRRMQNIELQKMLVHQRMSSLSQWGTIVATENISVLQQLTQINSRSQKVGPHNYVDVKKPCVLYIWIH